MGEISSLNAEELEECVVIFKAFDKNGSGDIDLQEMHGALAELGYNYSQSQTEEVIREVDYNHNGKVDFNEFCSVVQRMAARTEEETVIIDQCFEVFDQNKDGEISQAEFLSVLTQIGGFSDKTAFEVFTEVDVTGNGHIEKAEFAQFVRNYLMDEDDSKSELNRTWSSNR